MMRLFIGIAPEKHACDALRETADILRPIFTGRYVSAHLYHITIAFLGNTPKDRLPELERALSRASTGIAPFSVSLGKAGSFGTVLWRGVDEGARELSVLAEAMRKSLTQSGISYDTRPFQAHITLARNAARASGIPIPPLPDASFHVRELLLYESTLRPEGPIYIPRLKAALS